MMKTRRFVVSSAIASGVLSLVLLQGAFAEIDIEGPAAQNAHEESAVQTPDAPCKGPAPCCSTMKASSSHSTVPPWKPVGRLINGFFAVGCSVNYWLTDWIVSDKCDMEARR